jgi:hypothetical protein
MTPLVWTDKTPTEPGMYWVREPEREPIIARLYRSKKYPESAMQVATTSGGYGSLPYFFEDGALFAGPIPYPEEPI